MQNSNSHFAIAPGSHALASRPFLGSQVVDGLLIAQNYNRDDPSPRFQEFSEAYFKRFQRAPGYSAVSAYDAATVVLTALKNRQPGETPDYPQIPLGEGRGGGGKNPQQVQNRDKTLKIPFIFTAITPPP